MPASSEAAAAALKYRRDIDGLRAVAVLAVIGFHAFPTWVPGGFVGVDVFFVISGFLISHQLFTACDRGAFSIRDFYVRRIRRIFPALLLVLAATAAFGWIVLTPVEFKNLQEHLAASAFFSNNFLLWYEAGYFDAPSKTKPLLHLWSLGVEEQFYIVWPWLIFWFWRRRLNRTTVIGIIAIASLMLSAAMVSNASAAAAFYLPHSRLWQLAAGAWLASMTLDEPGRFARWVAGRLFMAPGERESRAAENVMAVAGLALIALGFAALGQMGQPSWWTEGRFQFVTATVRFVQREIGVTPQAASYPGWPALIPTLGAMLTIAAGPAAWLNRRLLGNPVPVFIGLISYPLYLWHWPMLSFLSVTEQGRAPRSLILSALALSFVLATISYLFVERPLRGWIKTTTPRRAAVLATVLLASGGFMAWATVSGRFLPPGRVATAIDERAPVALHERPCRALTGLLGGYCQQFIEEPVTARTALVGDSHAAHLFPGLGARLRDNGENLIMLGEPGCPPFLNVERLNEKVDSTSTCVALNRQTVDYLNGANDIRRVVMAFRGGIYENNDAEGATPIRFRGTELVGRQALEAGLTETIRQLSAHGKQLTVSLPVPKLTFELDECLGRPWSISPRPRRTPCAVPRAEVMALQAEVRRFVSTLATQFPITVVDPLTALCDEQYCWAVTDGRARYSDNNHLGWTGSATVATIFPLDQ